MAGVAEALGVDLVDLLRARGARAEPALARDDLDAADRRAIARRHVEDGGDGFAGERVGAELGLRQVLQHRLLLAGRGRVDAGIERLAQILRDRGIALAGVGARLRRDLGGEQAEDQPVLVRAPARAVEAQEGGAGALLAAEAEASVRKSLDEPFEADRTSTRRRPSRAATRSMTALLTMVLPMAASARQPRGCGRDSRSPPRDNDWGSSARRCG